MRAEVTYVCDGVVWTDRFRGRKQTATIRPSGTATVRNRGWLRWEKDLATYRQVERFRRQVSPVPSLLLAVAAVGAVWLARRAVSGHIAATGYRPEATE